MRNISGSIRHNISLGFGFGLAQAILLYGHLTMFGMIYNPFTPVANTTFGIISTLFSILLAVLLLWVSFKHGFDFSCFIPSAVLFFSLLVGYLSSITGNFDIYSVCLCGFAYGFGTVFLLGKWFKVLVEYSLNRPSLTYLYSTLFGLVLASAFTYLDSVAVLIIGGLSLLCSSILNGHYSKCDRFFVFIPNKPQISHVPTHDFLILGFPLVGVGIYACILSLLSCGQNYSLAPTTSVFMYNSLITARILVVAAYIGFFSYFKKGFDPVLIFKLVFPISLFALLLIAFHGAASYRGISFILFVGYNIVYIACVIYFLDLLVSGLFHSYVAWGCFTVMESLFYLGGFAIGMCIGELNGLVYPSVSVSAFAAAYILSLGLFLFSFKIRRDSSTAEISDAANFGAKYSLSPRELDVLVNIDQGLNARAIAEKYELSEYTIRGYIKSIYAKTDVHSKQDLLKMFRETKKIIH